MKGIELARQWFEQDVRPALLRECPDILPHLAAGLAGHGSECFGFDDEISRDHDFTACVSLWLTERDEVRFGFRLARFYETLLRLHPPKVSSPESFGGASEHGICTIEDFFLRHLGVPGVPETWRQWLFIPEYAFAEALNGEIFYDGPGTFTAVRERICTGMPEDVRLKKIAARAALMAQSGQYNFSRCLRHGETGAAFLALAEFVRAAGSMIFLLNRAFTPYYKWMFRALRDLPVLGNMADPLAFLLSGGMPENMRAEMIEDICVQIADELRREGLSTSAEAYLEPHAVEIMGKIGNREIRSLHLMEG